MPKLGYPYKEGGQVDNSEEPEFMQCGFCNFPNYLGKDKACRKCGSVDWYNNYKDDIKNP